MSTPPLSPDVCFALARVLARSSAPAFLPHSLTTHPSCMDRSFEPIRTHKQTAVLFPTYFPVHCGHIPVPVPSPSPLSLPVSLSSDLSRGHVPSSLYGSLVALLRMSHPPSYTHRDARSCYGSSSRVALRLLRWPCPWSVQY